MAKQALLLLLLWLKKKKRMKKVLEKIGCLDSAFEKVKNGAKQETERFPALGLVVPSYQKIIIVTCSCGMAKLMLNVYYM